MNPLASSNNTLWKSLEESRNLIYGENDDRLAVIFVSHLDRITLSKDTVRCIIAQPSTVLLYVQKLNINDSRFVSSFLITLGLCFTSMREF